MSIAAVRTWPDLTIGTLITLLQTTFIVAGLAVFVELLSRATRNTAVAMAIGLAVGVSPMFSRTLAPPWEAAMFAAFASVALVWCRSGDRPFSSAGLLAATGIGIPLATALMVPTWTIMAATGCGIAVASLLPRFTIARRWLIGSAAAAALVLLVLAVLNLSRPDVFAGSTSWRALAACALPRPSMRLGETVSAMYWRIGPFGVALALLGAFVAVEQIGVWRSLAAAGLATCALALVAGAADSVPAVLAPWIVGLWCLAACGMQAVVIATERRSRASWVPSAILLALLPTMQISRVAGEERDDWVRPLGHQVATLRGVTSILNIVDSRARFVEEDSTVDVLLRAAIFGGRRALKPVTIVQPQADAIRRAMATGAVYAFPRGQYNLSYRGFVIEPVAAIAFRRTDLQERISGIAAITGSRPCQRLGDRWVDVSDASSSGRFALAADSETAYDAAVVYVGAEEPIQPQPDTWPARATRGFRFTVFDRRSKGDAERLQREAREMGLVNHDVLSAPSVVRLLLHRTPRAPHELAVTLGAPFTSGAARLADGAVVSGQLTLCDAPPIQIQSFVANID